MIFGSMVVILHHRAVELFSSRIISDSFLGSETTYVSSAEDHLGALRAKSWIVVMAQQIIN